MRVDDGPSPRPNCLSGQSGLVKDLPRKLLMPGSNCELPGNYGKKFPWNQNAVAVLKYNKSYLQHGIKRININNPHCGQA